LYGIHREYIILYDDIGNGSKTYMQGRETGGSESCKIVRFGAKITCACMSSHIDVD
jgi:hypothetical protein